MKKKKTIYAAAFSPSSHFSLSRSDTGIVSVGVGGRGEQAARACVCMCVRTQNYYFSATPFRPTSPCRVVPNTVTRSVRFRINRLIGLRAHNKKTISPRCFVAGPRTREKEKKKIKQKYFNSARVPADGCIARRNR